MSQRREEQSGQGLVELALILPGFLLLLFGLFDVGLFVYTNSALSQAAREGARVAAAEAGWVGVPGAGCVDDASAIGDWNPGAHVCPPDVAALDADVVGAVNRMAVGLGSIGHVHLSCNAGTESDPAPSGDWTDVSGGGGNRCVGPSGTASGSPGDLVSVRVEYTYQPVTPLIDSIIGSVSLSGSASMTIN